MNFADLNLHPLLLKAITACNYTTPTPIQAKAIPLILQGKDLIASAQTGTGKTASYMLPILHQLSAQPRSKQMGNRARILILTPTRELAEQVTTVAIRYGKFIKFAITSIIGGTSYRRQLQALARPLDIIVATPGRLLDHVENHGLDLSAIETLVLDEADRMLDMGFLPAVKQIIQLTPANRQTLLFSATFDNRIANLTRNIMRQPEQLRLSTENKQKTSIEQKLLLVRDPQHKAQLLSELLQEGNVYKAIIFSATKRNTDKLAKQLCQQGYLAAPLHGDMKQNRRLEVVKQMRANRLQLLVATDVAARGIDITDISHVINYDFPKFAEDYVHRIGRTGRAGKTGIAISMALPQEQRHIKQVERYLGHPLAVTKMATKGKALRPPKSRSEVNAG